MGTISHESDLDGFDDLPERADVSGFMSDPGKQSSVYGPSCLSGEEADQRFIPEEQEARIVLGHYTGSSPFLVRRRQIELRKAGVITVVISVTLKRIMNETIQVGQMFSVRPYNS